MRYLFVTTVLLISACSRNDAPHDDQTPASPQSQENIDLDLPSNNDRSKPIAVATTDQPIALPAPATGLVFWEHPNLPYEGLVIAATAEGVFSHTLAGTEPVNTIAGLNARGASISYISPNDNTQPAESIFTTYDVTNTSFRFFRIDGLTRKFSENLFSIPFKDEFDDWCITSHQNNNALHLVILKNTRMEIIEIKKHSNSNFQITSLTPRTLKSSMKDCATDFITENIYGLSSDGNLYSLTSQSRANNHVETQGNEKIKRTKFFLLDEVTGLVHTYKAGTGALEGILQLADFDDNEGVHSASAIAIGSGNFGGLYRFGVIALASDGNVPAVRLTPFIAAARALEIPVDGPVNLRTLLKQEETVAPPSLPDITVDLDVSTNDQQQ